MHNYISMYFSKFKEELKAKRDRSSILQSSTDIGDTREEFCTVFLQEFLPANIMIASGEVIDSFGQSAKGGQQDIILYDSKLMRLNIARNIQVLFVEGCLAVIEVKSKLDKQEFFKALDKCRQFKELELSLFPLLPGYAYTVVDETFIMQSMLHQMAWESNIETFIKPKFYIFAYESVKSLDTVSSWVEEYISQESHSNYRVERFFPDLICVLDLGVIYRNNGFAFKLQPFIAGETDDGVLLPNDPIYLPERESELAIFAFHILEAVRLVQRESRLQSLDLTLNLRRYFLREGLIQETEVIEGDPEATAVLKRLREVL